mgnify:FL=1
MVLTQPEEVQIIEESIAVSIPLWFLRNGDPRRVAIFFTNRFHTTMVLTQPSDEALEKLAAELGFHTTMVLTQHRRKENEDC